MALLDAPAYSRAMKSLRLLVNGVLGLALVVQGVALASAPLALDTSAPAELAQAATADEMPCHGDAEPAATEAPPCACCDGGCVDMSSCAFSQPAAAIPAIRVHLGAVGQGAITARDEPAASISLSSLLRPPISVHA
jgi:hypothetical protein